MRSDVGQEFFGRARVDPDQVLSVNEKFTLTGKQFFESKYRCVERYVDDR
jgi:hypothetical protein